MSREPSGERGSAFVIAIFLLVVLTMLAMGVVATTSTDLKISDNYARSVETLYAAEAGANHAVVALAADPSLGGGTPAPGATPILQGQAGGARYKVWLYGARMYGNGTSAAFPVAGMRQLVVEATDGRRTRRLDGVISKSYPRALDRVVFACGDVDLDGSNQDTVTGEIFASGNLDIGCDLASTVYVTGEVDLSNGSDINGNVYANGDIDNLTNTQITGRCVAGGNVVTESKCGSVREFQSPGPVRDYCSSAGYDESMVDLTDAELQAIRDTASAQYAAGWSATSALALTGKHWVSGGDVVWTGNAVTYTGETVIVIDAGSFTCDGCSVSAASGAPSDSELVIVTKGGSGFGDIRFTATTATTSSFTGVLWAGIYDAGAFPSTGSVLVDGRARVEIKGTVVGLGTSGTVGTVGTNSELHIAKTLMKPWALVDQQSFRVSEWREVR